MAAAEVVAVEPPRGEEVMSLSTWRPSLFTDARGRRDRGTGNATNRVIVLIASISYVPVSFVLQNILQLLKRTIAVAGI